MGKIPNISESELEVMKLLWKESPLTSNEVIDRLDGMNDWSENTIKTFLNRLLNKGAIDNKQDGIRYQYYPAISYEDYMEEENKSFLDRVYDGAVGVLLSKFIEEEELTNEDIDDLQKILEDKKK